MDILLIGGAAIVALLLATLAYRRARQRQITREVVRSKQDYRQ